MQHFDKHVGEIFFWNGSFLQVSHGFCSRVAYNVSITLQSYFNWLYKYMEYNFLIEEDFYTFLYRFPLLIEIGISWQT